MTNSSPFRQLEEIDRDAFNENCDYIHPDAVLNKMYELHELLAAFTYEAYPNFSSNQREAITDCLQAIRKEFLFGNLTFLRAHSTDGENYRRKAVEFCAFAVEIIKEPHSATVWLDAIRSKRKYKVYKNTFKIMELLKGVSETGIRLSLLYEELCKEVHASPFAIKTQTRIYVAGDVRINQLYYHDDYDDFERYDLAQRFGTGIRFDFYIILILKTTLLQQFPTLKRPELLNLKIEEFYRFLESEIIRIKELPGSRG